MPHRQPPRALDRPYEGDVQPCPFCRALMYFQEPKSKGAEPGWFCGCGYQIITRRTPEPSFEEQQRALADRRAKAFRKSMAVRARADRLRKESQRIRRRKK